MIQIIPRDDPKQTLRVKRSLMSFATYILFTLIILYCYYKGLIVRVPGSMFLLCVLIVITNLIFYGIIRSGWNLRFKDPSLTMAQMLAATVWTMVVAYYYDEGRAIMLLIYMSVFTFGTFRLNIRQFAFMSVIAMLSYGSVILLLRMYAPQSIDLRLEMIYLTALVVVLMWFSFIGSYMNSLRMRLGRTINELNAANTLLRESEERYRFLADNARDVIWSYNFASGFTYMSPSVKYLRGYSSEEAMKLSLEQTLTPESYKLAVDQIETEIQLEMSGKRHDADWSRTIELEQFRKDGSTVWTEVMVNILYDETGTLNGIMGITRDITERKYAEKEMRSREKLQGMLEMSGAVCHELNQPLQVMMSTTDLLLTEGRVDEGGRELLETLQRAVDEIGSLTGKIMRVADYEVKDYMGGKSKIIDIDRSTAKDD